MGWIWSFMAAEAAAEGAIDALDKGNTETAAQMASLAACCAADALAEMEEAGIDVGPQPWDDALLSAMLSEEL